ncbi:hypothetical protein QE152_g32514 [Popillia japonica]|uniref:Uncharacterized protein n=1 Tax=Popillia japonica TaxID=7064 RepID=A0AAW1IZH0_POPJA
MTNQVPITELIEQKELKWYGHVQRMSADALTRRVGGSKVDSKRRVGRSGKTMDQRVEELALKRGKLVNGLRTMTQDRRMWRTCRLHISRRRKA